MVTWRPRAPMTGALGPALPIDAALVMAGSVIVCVVLVSIAGLVVTLWRRSDSRGAVPQRAVAADPRTDSHAVAATASPLLGPPDARLAVEPSPARVAPAATTPPIGPHPSGLGVAELAAVVEDGLASLRAELDTLDRAIQAIAAAGAVPDDLPSRPAAQQVALMDQMTVVVAADLDRAHRVAVTVADDVVRGHEALEVVHRELARVGLPGDFFVAMDAAAAALAVDLVRAHVAIERLRTRFEVLVNLFSSAHAPARGLAELGEVLDQAVATTRTWRQSSDQVDLVAGERIAPALPG